MRDLWHDRLEDAHVLADQVETRLAGPLVCARCDDHDAGVVAVDIDQHHLGEQPALHQRERGCRSYEPASHDANFTEIDGACTRFDVVCHEPFSFVDFRFAIVPQND